MKNFKKIASAIAALSLAACMVAPVATMTSFADATKGKVTFTGEVTEEQEHTYTAYKIFDGTATADGFGGTAELTNIKWANSEKAEDFLQALKSDPTIGSDFEDCTTAVDVVNVLKSYTSKSEQAKAFAAFAVSQKDNLVTAGTSTDGTIELANDGYYVISETTSDVNAVTNYLLGVYDAESGAEIAVKASAPTVVKKVKEDDKTPDGSNNLAGEYDEKYNDVADYSIGESVPFVLQATLPSTLADYNDYYIKFTDNLGKEFNAPESFTVKIGGSADITVSKGDDGNYTVAGDTASQVKVTVTGGTDSDWKIEIEILDVKKYTVDAVTNNHVTVEYSAVLNEKAEIGAPGNYNDVFLTYDNNPTVDGNGTSKPDDTKDTPKDGVVVFTYKVDVHKYDGVNEAAKESDWLAGAVFALKDSTGKYLAKDNTSKLYKWVDATVADGSITTTDGSVTLVTVTSKAGEVVSFEGLDDEATYTLVEVKAPDGYNLLADGVEVKLKATTTMDNSQDGIGENADGNSRKGSQFTKLDYFYGDKTEVGGVGDSQVYIANNSGATLPSTGGIGTTLFYLGGGALVAVAGVMLITKKRMTKE